MKIERRTEFVSTYLQHRLGDVSEAEIDAALPQARKCRECGKVTVEWQFYADGKPCGIWDYRGARWSAYGPREVFEKLGLPIVETVSA